MKWLSGGKNTWRKNFVIILKEVLVEHAVPFVTSQWAIYQNCALTYTLKAQHDLKHDSS